MSKSLRLSSHHSLHLVSSQAGDLSLMGRVWNFLCSKRCEHNLVCSEIKNYEYIVNKPDGFVSWFYSICVSIVT